MKHVLFVCLFVLMAGAAMAQGCSVCTKTAAEMGEKGAKGLNMGIVYLAFIPLGIIGTLGFMWWRSQSQRES